MRIAPKSFVPALVAFVVGTSACSPKQSESRSIPEQSSAEIAGRIVSSDVREASGLARSLRNAARLWVINDGGSPALLHAIGIDGSYEGAVEVSNLHNRDWEDLASFELNGAHYLLIADIGDNGASRDELTLHFVAEPDPHAATAVAASRTVSFRYPGGPRDAESIAVDAEEGAAYVLSKRTVPAELYRVPLNPVPVAPDPVAAEYLGPVDSLPQPTADDLEHAAARQSWHWQPTAMDFSPDRSFVSILTYRAVYTYPRNDGQSWYQALQSDPIVRPLSDVENAEALAVAPGAIFVTVEANNPPLVRFDL